MIILSFEVKGELVERYDRYQDYYFVIPELLEDPLYKEFIVNTPKYIMLDNGMYESGYPEVDTLLSNAREINAREVVLPDYLYKTEETRKASRTFLDGLSKSEVNEFRWMLVIQGNTIYQWRDAYKSLTEEFAGEFFSIGIPKCPHKQLNFRTVAMQSVIEAEYILEMPHHMLGLNDPSEILYMPYVRSCDTAWPFKLEKHRDILRRINLLRKLAR